jgi:8-oxo-dGTP pyrophosphatase MutT (NUDIX family)
MITNFKKYIMNESITNFDLSKLVTVIQINKDEEGNYIYKTRQGKDFILKKEDVNKISLVNDELLNRVNSGKEITKYFETEQDNNVIIYAANFAADIIALREGRVYLIERGDGRGWAIPGGFIDAGENPEQAAKREFQEETLGKLEDIKSIEPLKMMKTSDPREINFFTFPFIFHMKLSADLKYGDDAVNGKWQMIGRASRSKLAFTHHNKILQNVNF